MNKLALLDSKLRSGDYFQTFSLKGNTLIKYKRVTDYVLSVDELEYILDMTNSKQDMMMLVTQGGMGFYPAYNIVRGNYVFIGNEDPYIEEVIAFTEKQLPIGYDFDKLSETFNHTRNLKKIEFFKQEEPKHKSAYLY